MAGFVQIVEFKSSRIDEIQALGEKYAESGEAGDAGRITVTADRDRPNYYLSVIEFDSFEKAMENSRRPETDKFASQMAELCDGPPKFYNLDVVYAREP